MTWLLFERIWMGSVRLCAYAHKCTIQYACQCVYFYVHMPVSGCSVIANIFRKCYREVRRHGLCPAAGVSVCVPECVRLCTWWLWLQGQKCVGCLEKKGKWMDWHRKVYTSHIYIQNSPYQVHLPGHTKYKQWVSYIWSMCMLHTGLRGAVAVCLKVRNTHYLDIM